MTATAAPPAVPATPIAAERSQGRIGMLLDLVPLALAIVAEAAWIYILGGLVAEYTLQEPSLGIAALAGFVIVGVVASRTLAPRIGERWPSVALLLVAIAGLIGWLAAPAAREALTTQGVFPALAVNPAGWVAALAVLRGYAHAKLPVSAGTLATVFAVGVPCIAIAALAGGMIAEPYRARFLADSAVAVVIFAGSVILALAIARLTAVGAGSGFDWRRNPTWVALLVVLVLVTLAVAVPASGASPLIALVAGAAVGPLMIVALVLGFERKTIRSVVIVTVAAVLIIGLIRLLGSGPVAITLPSSGIGGEEALPTDPGPAGQFGLLIGILVAMILVLILARLWMRRSTPETSDLNEVRSIDHGEDREGVRNPRWRLGRGLRGAPDPTTATEAYVRLLADIDARPTVRREPAETPAAHAARMRHTGGADLSLDLLAADYALARFAGVELSPAEERRAVGRWRRLRRSLGATSPASPAAGAPRT